MFDRAAEAAKEEEEFKKKCDPIVIRDERNKRLLQCYHSGVSNSGHNTGRSRLSQGVNGKKNKRGRSKSIKSRGVKSEKSWSKERGRALSNYSHMSKRRAKSVKSTQSETKAKKKSKSFASMKLLQAICGPRRHRDEHAFF
jgi:hypothetical protein